MSSAVIRRSPRFLCFFFFFFSHHVTHTHSHRYPLFFLLSFSTTSLCTRLKTTPIMCMMSCGRPCTLPCLLPWMAWAAWTCGTSTMTLRCVHTLYVCARACVNVANTGRDGCGFCVISLCVDVRVFGVLRACCWASARTTQPNIQDFSLPSTPPPPVPPHPSQHTHNSRFPRGRFPQTLL